MTTRAADVPTEQDTDNPGAAVGLVALAVLLVLLAGALALAAWFFPLVLP